MKAQQQLAQDKKAYGKVAAPCPEFGTCGGCTLQDLSYADQLRLKQQRLLKILEPINPALTVEIEPMEDPWRYRNKAEFTFGAWNPRRAAPRGPASGGEAVRGDEAASGAPLAGTADGPLADDSPARESQLVLGYHATGSFWKIVDFADCRLLPEPMNAVMRTVRELARASGLPPYHARSHQGFFRHLLVRASRATGQVMVCLVTSPECGGASAREAVQSLADALRARHPEVCSVYWGVNSKVADTAAPDELHLLAGSEHLADRIGPFAVRLHPMNFLQPNPVQAERLYARLAAMVSAIPDRTAWDLYCGIGLISLYLSGACKKVYGVDIEPRNIELAQANAAANARTNIDFRVGKTEDVLTDKRFWLTEAKPDLVVVDPPRSGLHEKVIGSLLAARPKQLVYVSCNAVSLGRDLQLLTTGFPRYFLRQAAAFDLFPHTNHFEVLTLLERA